jgi:nucleoside-diphosphate-sugar epimerase
MRVLVTGGTGKLGRELLPKLARAGHDVVALSRRPLPEDVPATHVRGDLSTGEGVDNAMSGCDAVLHAATGGFGDRYSLRWAVFHRAGVDVRGTQMLLEAAERTGINHFLFTSIVGMDRVPYWPNIYRFFKHKLAAERLVRESSTPWTIARMTQFHPLLDQIFKWQFGSPGPVIVLDAQGQPIDPSEAADAVITYLGRNPTLDVVEVGGPEVLTARDIVNAWTTRSGVDRKAHVYRAPGKMGRAMAEGALTCPDKATGTITWAEWLSFHCT